MTDTFVSLLRAIREHSGLELDAIRDAGRYGADAGFGGFIYTTDAVKFYRANEDAIYALLREDADDFGAENVDAFVSGFARADMLDTPDGRANLLAWYALERVGQWLTDRHESR